MKLKFFNLILASLLVMFLVFTACPIPSDGESPEENGADENSEENNAKESKKEITRVVSTKLFEGPIESFIESASDVESLNMVEIYPHLTGIHVTEVLADEGDEVKMDQVLARLDGAETELELSQAQTNLEEARHKLEKAQIALKEALERLNNAKIKEAKAKKDYEKSKKMHEDELVAEDELALKKLEWEQAHSDLDLMTLQQNQGDLDLKLCQTDVSKMDIAVKTIQLKLKRTQIRAPFNGFVVTRTATKGMTVSTSTALFTLVNNEELVTNLHIPQEALQDVRVGMPVKITCGAAPDGIFLGEVTIINPIVDEQSGTIKLRVNVLGDHKARLRPGMFIKAKIITASRDNALLVPRKAVFYDDEKPAFFYINPDNKVRKIHFKPGASTKTALEIQSVLPIEQLAADLGLPEEFHPEDRIVPNAKIVIVGQDNLKNGDSVLIVKELN